MRGWPRRATPTVAPYLTFATRRRVSSHSLCYLIALAHQSATESESKTNHDDANVFLFTVADFGPVRCFNQGLRADLSLQDEAGASGAGKIARPDRITKSIAD